MSNAIVNIEATLKSLKTNPFVLGCNIPLGYCAGYPIVQVKNDRLCLMVPYLKFKTTGKVDQTLVYPIRYVVTVELPEENPATFYNLEFDNKFKKIDFTKPVGKFRHDSVKDLTKSEYKAKKKELLDLYSKLANNMIGCSEFTADDEKQFVELLNMLIEPSVLPIYKALDKKFYDKYIISEA